MLGKPNEKNEVCENGLFALVAAWKSVLAKLKWQLLNVKTHNIYCRQLTSIQLKWFFKKKKKFIGKSIVNNSQLYFVFVFVCLLILIFPFLIKQDHNKLFCYIVSFGRHHGSANGYDI